MKCDQAKDWLLQAETPAALSTAPREVDEHVRACPECRRLLQKLVRLEEDWRALPSPPGLDAAQRRMLKKAAAVPPRSLPRRSGFRYVGAWAAAAAILIAAGIGIWFAVKPNPPPASNVIDQLIAWNLDLSQVRDKNERQRLFQARHDSIITEVQSSPLGDEEKQLAGGHGQSSAQDGQGLEEVGSVLISFLVARDVSHLRHKARGSPTSHSSLNNLIKSSKGRSRITTRRLR